MLSKSDALRAALAIDGWMSEDELSWLYDRAREMASIIEIGAWKGRTTKALLEGCWGPVYAVDHWEGTPGEPLQQEKGVYKQFMQNVGGYGYLWGRVNLRIVREASPAAAVMFRDASVDMVFIDGDHRYEAVKADIEAWRPKARKLIAGHDYGNAVTPGVQQAVDEAFDGVERIGFIWARTV